MDIEYKEVACEELARVLAEEAWGYETKDVADEIKYQIDTIERGGVLTIERCIADEWARLYWDLKEKYIQLIMMFTKPEEENDHHKEAANNKGTDPTACQ